MSENKSLVPNNFYKPSELLGIFKNFLSNKEINAVVLCLHGVYIKSEKIYGNRAYDRLRDEDSVEELTIIVPVHLRDDLKNGNLVSVYGTLDRHVNSNGSIQILLNVSRVEKEKDIAISEDEIKRAELRRIKGERGYKNVDGILEAKLYANKRPRVALVYAESSITNADFEKGLEAAKSNIDFYEYRVSFANSAALKNTLEQLDKKGYDVVAVVRGGGSGIEKLDDLAVVETMTYMSTATIYGAGHEKENLFLRNIADKVIPIPFALGTYFRDLVESVVEKRNNSRAVLVQEVKKQYEKQIEDSNKKNQELQGKLKELTENQKKATEAQQEAIKKHYEQVLAMGKQNQELQKKLAEITKANETAQKQQSEAMGKLQNQMKEQSEAHNKAQQEFNASLKKMQETNGELNKSLSKLTAQNTQTTRELNEARDKQRKLEQQLQNNSGDMVWKVIAIAAIIAFIIALIL